jgi:hypothetical protein
LLLEAPLEALVGLALGVAPTSMDLQMSRLSLQTTRPTWPARYTFSNVQIRPFKCDPFYLILKLFLSNMVLQNPFKIRLNITTTMTTTTTRRRDLKLDS